MAKDRFDIKEKIDVSFLTDAMVIRRRAHSSAQCRWQAHRDQRRISEVMARRRVRPALMADLQSVMAVLDAARGIMRSEGNTSQWVNGYPSGDDVVADIADGHGFVVEDAREGSGGAAAIVGYFAFIPSPEPTYSYIEGGEWLQPDAPYHVVHRIGSLPDAHGVFRSIMDWCFQRDRNIRIDTHRDNRIMQHCIDSYGFTFCGIIYLESGDPRLAYQKIL